MKKILITLLLLSVFMVVSCEDEEREKCYKGDIRIVECYFDPEMTQKQVCDSEGQWIDSGDCYKWEPDEYVVDCTDTECKVAAGKFWRGCNEAFDDECQDDENEKPYREVELSAYKIDKYEVTAGEYQKCVDAGDCNNSNESEPHYYAYSKEDSYCNLGTTGKSNHPMNCVTWHGAKAYCEWAGKRLPTEAEWEKAARGTDGRKYPWGNTPVVSCKHAVMYDSNAGGYGCGTGGTMPVGSKPLGVSPYGAYDMSGNVWEWTNDWYAGDYYETSPSENPAGPESGSFRVIRGGSWNNYSQSCRSAYRYSNTPTDRGSGNGFRCARTE